MTRIRTWGWQLLHPEAAAAWRHLEARLTEAEQVTRLLRRDVAALEGRQQ